MASTPRSPAWACLVCLGLLLGHAAWAHRLKVLLADNGEALVGTAYYDGSGKARGVAITLLDAAGQEHGRATSDEQGSFRLSYPAPGSYQVRVQDDQGHLAESQVTVARGGIVVAPAADERPWPLDWEARVERLVARQVLPLRQELDAYESQTRLRDLLGGLGWLVGLAGLWQFWRTRRGARPRAGSGDETG